MYAHLYKKLLNSTKGFQLFDRDSFTTLDFTTELKAGLQIDLTDEVKKFLESQGVSDSIIKAYIEIQKTLFLEEIASYDHPLINQNRLVFENFDQHVLAFRLDHAEQALKMQGLLEEFRVLTVCQNDLLIFYFALFHDGHFDMRVLNTRRAYFFDELIF